ncbi:flagellar assembly protein FliH [Alkalihalobacillus pseudalcaliphilus]|uniref:flagellar assembly protein FliH n=1 Tax=Alkalihalobacillus pseudalcaliphilus TaxID=79884 RepID=UPI00064E03F8|nr:flagellar assembly protein FliH [Alkalihalobacillus pseudalcaliphilus]KMK77217.1 hypothetical protein AB990_06615 [Alkalihalobacillus pseudalcaliphilus]
MSSIIKSTQALGKGKEIKIRTLTNFIPDFEVDETSQVQKEENFQAEIEQIRLDAKKQAEDILNQAQREAKDLEAKLEQKRTEHLQELEQLKEEAIQSGYKHGFSQGKEEAYQQYVQLISEANGMIDLAKIDYDHMLEEAQPQIIDIAYRLTEKVLGERLTDSEVYWFKMLKQVMTELREHEEVKIYVHPNWYEQTLKQKEELNQLLTRTEKLYIYSDVSLPELGCVVETRLGKLEATLDKQLKELKKQLLELLEELQNDSTSH